MFSSYAHGPYKYLSCTSTLKRFTYLWNMNASWILFISATKDLRGAFLVLQLHDELIYEVSQEDAAQVAGVIKETMEKATSLRVKLPVKVKLGSSWGRLKELEIWWRGLKEESVACFKFFFPVSIWCAVYETTSILACAQ